MSQNLEKLRGPLKRVAAIHDISGFGKCSLTVVLPILSAAGLEVCCMPTAVLSTHTGGFTGFTYRNLTNDLPDFMDHWKSLSLHFNAIYSGFLGSPKQAELIMRFIDLFNTPETLVCIDPAMADFGKLYQVFNMSMVDHMKKLCSKADLLIPNITEADFLLNRPYHEGPYDKQEIFEILIGLSELGPSKVVLTSVQFDKASFGAACYDSETDTVQYEFSPFVAGDFHGTGDVFGSFLIAALMNDYSLSDALSFAVSLTHQTILRTKMRGTPLKDGVDFEGVLPDMIHLLQNHKIKLEQ